MELKDAQKKIREFDIARGWENDWNIKDLLLNMTEEGGELWDLIKWVDDKEKQKKVIAEKEDEVSDYIGDVLYIILKMANQMGVDAGKALNETCEEYEKRMPAEKMREVKHANKHLGGWDNKEYGNN